MLTFLSAALTTLVLASLVQDAPDLRAPSPGHSVDSLVQTNDQPEAAALMIRGLTQHRLGNNEAALAALREALTLVQTTTRGSVGGEPARQEATLNAALADVYLDVDDRATGLYYARRAFALDPRAEFAVRVAELLTLEGDRDAAVALLEAFDSANPDKYSQRIIDEARRGFSGQPPAAVGPGAALPEGRVVADAAAAHTLLGVAMTRLNEGRPDLAIEPLEKLLALSARDVTVWTALARARFESGDAEGAARTAADGLVLFPGSTELIVSAIRADRARPGINVFAWSAAQLAELASEKPPREAAHLTAYLALAGRTGDDGFDAALALDPGNPLALASLALAEVRSGDVDKARQRLAQLPNADEVTWEVAAAAGLALSISGDTPAAALYLNRACTSPYASVEVLTAAGDAASNLGESASARSLWRRALELAPTDATLIDRLNR